MEHFHESRISDNAMPLAHSNEVTWCGWTEWQRIKSSGSSGMLHCVVGQVGLTLPSDLVTQHNITEDVNLLQHCCESLKSHIVKW